MNDWRPQILRREEKSPFLCWKKERQRARERESERKDKQTIMNS